MDNSSSNKTSIDVGGRIRTLRSLRSISMRALAKLSGLSANALSMIERGLTSPSVSTLIKLSQALEVPVTSLFREEPSRKKIVFCKNKDRNAFSFQGGIWEAMGGERFEGQMEAAFATISPNARSGTHSMYHSGYEFVYCVTGKLEYQVEEDLYILEPGDSLIFTTNMAHKWKNLAQGETKVIFVVSGFEQQESPGEIHRASTGTNE